MTNNITVEDALIALASAKNGVPEYINWSKEGGAEVHRVNYNWYVLFRITQYGGSPHYEGTFYENDIDRLIELAFSWT